MTPEGRREVTREALRLALWVDERAGDLGRTFVCKTCQERRARARRQPVREDDHARVRPTAEGDGHTAQGHDDPGAVVGELIQRAQEDLQLRRAEMVQTIGHDEPRSARREADVELTERSLRILRQREPCHPPRGNGKL